MKGRDFKRHVIYFKERKRVFLASLLKISPLLKDQWLAIIKGNILCYAKVRIYMLDFLKKHRVLCLCLESGRLFLVWLELDKERAWERESSVLNGLVYHMSGPSLYNKDVLTLAIQRGEIMHIITNWHIHHHEFLGINAYGAGLNALERKFNKHSPDAVELKPRNLKLQWKRAWEDPPRGGIMGPVLRTKDPSWVKDLSCSTGGTASAGSVGCLVSTWTKRGCSFRGLWRVGCMTVAVCRIIL